MSIKTPEKPRKKSEQEQENTSEESLQERKNLKFFKKLELNKKILNDRMAADVSYDAKVREMNFGEKDAALVYVNGLVDSKLMTMILNQLAGLKREQLVPNALKHYLERYLTDISVETVNTFDEAIDQVLAGVLLFLVEDEEKGLLIDARSYPGRNPEEPDIERVVRGARDGFVENIVINTALTRRRIRDERLRMEIMRVGNRSKTDVCVSYIKDIADPGLVELVKEKIKEIDVDGIPMAEKSIEEFLIGKHWNPYPMVRYTERPDVAASHLLEGHVLVFVDTSPSVMITPSTFFHHIQHAEEFRQKPIVGAYLRWVRFFGIFASLFILPLWMFFALHTNYLPPSLAFIGPKSTGNIPLFLQFIFAEIGTDLMRLAAVHTPAPLATAMGLVAAVMVGEVAMKVGIFVPETILYLAVAAIGTFATPSYELSLANRIVRLVLLVTTYFLGVPGFMITATVFIVWLASTTALNKPYMWPFLPFNWGALKNIIIRPAVPNMKYRPSIVHPLNDERK